MTELEKEESYIAMRQREDAKEKPNKASNRRFKLNTFRIPIVVLVAVAICSVSMITASTIKARPDIIFDETFDMSEWNRGEAVRIYIRPEYIDEVYEDINDAFAYIGLKRTIIISKIRNEVLQLLLVLNEGGIENQRIAGTKLISDKRVKSCNIEDEEPFEYENTLSLAAASDTVKVGKTLTVYTEGVFNTYYPTFLLDTIKISVKNSKRGRDYTPADFPGLKLASVKKEKYSEIGLYKVDVLLTLKLAESGYFNAINALNALALNPKIEGAALSSTYYSIMSPHEWCISDRTVADFVIVDEDYYKHYNPSDDCCVYSGYVEFEWRVINIMGLKPGTVTVTYRLFSDPDSTISLEIKVTI